MMKTMQSFGKLRTSLNKLIYFWLPVVFWMGLIFYLSGQPGLKVAEGPLDFWTRKLAHVGEYAILFLLLFRALRGSFSWRQWEVYLGAGVISFLFAATDEFHQLFVRLREGKVVDLGFDLLGIVVAIFFLHFRQKHP